MSGGPNNSLRALYTNALSRIDFREQAALSKAMICVGTNHYVPAWYRRREIRAFYNKLKEGLNDDYCHVLQCFETPGSRADALRTIQYLAGTKGSRKRPDQKTGGDAA